MKARNITAAVFAASFLLSGCMQDISGSVTTEPPAVEALAKQDTTVTVTEAPETTVTTTSAAVTSVTGETEETTDTSETTEVSEDKTTEPSEGKYLMYSDEYKDYPLSDEYKDFISRCVFVGDSICSGLKAYDILPSDHVVAVGNIAARNIFEDWVEFKIHGDTMTLIPALVELKPEYIVFSMGMNDVNLTSEQTFCNNYDNILSQVQSFLPDSKLIVLSITPVTYGESGKLFTTNENIDSFNAALKSYLDSTGKWTYADVEHEMKNTHNMLKDNYLGSTDGVHLAPEAYYCILYQLCERMVDGKIYNLDGSFSYTEGIKMSAVTTTTEVTTTKKDKSDDDEDDKPVMSGTLNISDPD